MRGIILKLGLACGLLLLWLPSWGQVRGLVYDAETGDSLAFVYVLRVNASDGCFSGLDGRFSLPNAHVGDSIKVHLMGYIPQTLAVTSTQSLRIALQPGGVNLADVLIVPTENPALRIMRQAVAHRAENDPQNRSHYSCDTYNKLTGSPKFMAGMRDSTLLKIHIFLSETVTHRLQIRPGKVQEKILSARLAGYPGKVIPFTASDLQDLSFYGNYVTVFGQQFLSPVSQPGLNQYRFTLRDTVVVGADSIFTIEIAPKSAGIDAFQGNLRIHSRDWALSTVQVQLVTGEGGILIASGEIKQIYTQLPEGAWLPSELITEIDSKPMSSGAPFTFHFSGYSSMVNHQLNDSTRGAFRPEDEIVVADGAGQEDSTLQQNRIIPLSPKDTLSYKKLDSLGKEVGTSKIIDQAWKLVDNRLGIGVVDLLLDQIMSQNRVEKLRLGGGLATNEKMSKRFSLGGYLGWGFEDAQAKFGGRFQITPLGDDRLYAGLSYSEDLVESGYRRIGIKPLVGLHQNFYREVGVRRWFLTNMEYVVSSEAWVGMRLPTDLGLRLARRWEQVTPAYSYTFQDSSRFRFDEAEALLRWAPGARYIQQDGHRLATSNRGPVAWLRYTRGLQSQQGDFAYNAAAMSISQEFAAFRGGKGVVILQAGWNDRSVPRSRMRVFRSNYDRRNFTDLPGAFNTMRFDEFAADYYAEGFVYLSPKMRWLHIGSRIRPQLTCSIGAAWGDLYPGTRHAQLQMRAPSQFYLEPGLSITGLLPAPKKDNMYAALLRRFGLGLYYRVGAYTLPTFKENIAFRISVNRM